LPLRPLKFCSHRALKVAAGVVFSLTVGLSMAAAGWPGQKPTRTAAVPPGKKIDYAKQVKPLLVERCYACHGNGTRLGGLALDTYDGLLKGGQSGPSVVVHEGAKSLLIKLVSGGDPTRIMPARGKRLTPAEIEMLKTWIDQGASFGEGMNKPSSWTAPLAPRHPAIPPTPASSGLSNPIDRLLVPYFRANKVQQAGLVDDRTYARRVYLDIIGLLPSTADLNTFLKDTRPDKRAQLVRKLLSNDEAYAEHWLTFWNDMLRNDYAGTGYIDGGRTQITGWLYNALRTNMPYDRFVAQLVNPSPESAGFANGIVWRGVVNASQTPQMQASQNISQVFMGVNMKCASCHNSFISTWKLADAYGMAGIYADKALEMVRCDKPQGTVAPVKFIYPELGAIDASAPRAKRLEQLAAAITSKGNGRLSRTLINRLWAKLMGRGLVEPTDEMDNRPWNPDLLDWISSNFADNGYDVKKAIELIATSRAYQLPAMSLKSERAENFVFSGPVVKRMTAEQFVDAVSILTDVWQSPAAQSRIMGGKPILPAGNRAAIKFQSGLMKIGAVDIDVDVTGAKVLSLIATDGGNGVDFDWADWVNPRLEGPRGTVKLTDLKWRGASVGYGKIQINKSIVEKALRLGDKTYPEGIGTHANSIITYELPEGVTRFKATAGPDAGAIEQPGSKTSVELFVVTGDRSLIDARAAMAYADPLMRALGRPNREQVVTERSPVATTLQAIELTNGGTLESMLSKGAEKWAKEGPPQAPQLVQALYEQALGRPPTSTEKQVALEIVGNPVRKDGIEDLLWALIMLPEFQLEY
jgi:mono/diheme cytochrome c family protein